MSFFRLISVTFAPYILVFQQSLKEQEDLYQNQKEFNYQ